MAKPTVLDFVLVRGDNLLLKVELLTAAREPYDASAVQIGRWQVAPDVSSAPVVQKTSPNVSFVLENQKWFVVIPILPDDTSALPKGLYYHECEIRDSMGNTITIFTGTISLQPDLI